MDELPFFPVPGDGIDGFAVGDGFVEDVEGLPTILIWIAVEGVVFVLAEGVVLARDVSVVWV